MASSGYIFARDLRASIRYVSAGPGPASSVSVRTRVFPLTTISLNYQHLAIKQLCGFLLHPSIPLQDIVDDNTLYVADIGTGTGLWPIELGQQLPSARIAGFDISSDQFPPAEWRPHNVTLEAHNVLTPFPEHHRGKYHIVHVRFFVTLLNSEDQAQAFVENLSTLLRPGGFIQWLDADPATAKAIGIDSTTPSTATERLVELMRKPHPNAFYGYVFPSVPHTISHGYHMASYRDLPSHVMQDQVRDSMQGSPDPKPSSALANQSLPRWIPKVPKVLQSEGLGISAHDTISCSSFPATRTLWNQCYLLGYQEFWAVMTEKAGDQSEEARRDTAQRAATSIAELELESRAGWTLDMNYFCIVARKVG